MTNQNAAVVINVINNDSDPDGSIVPSSVAIAPGVTNGSTTNNNNGTVSYTPDTGFTGSGSFTYTVKDDKGAISNTATVTITVSEFANAADAVSINNAIWNTSSKQLYISGENAGRRGDVEIYSAASNELLSTITANWRGAWDVSTSPFIAPCTVKVVSHGTSDEKMWTTPPATVMTAGLAPISHRLQRTTVL